MNTDSVSLVVPGRNCASTLRQCIDAVVPLLERDGERLAEIIFVDDGSTDATTDIASEYPIRCITCQPKGPGGARNVGWRAASSPLVWFIDSDCVARPDTLSLLLSHMNDPRVAGVGGSYGNQHPDSLLACLIHEEIIARHTIMPTEVDFLGGFNVLYRRSILEAMNGFDELHFNGPGSPGAEDAELAYRIRAAGHSLRFEPRSVVGHHHPTRLWRYLRSQRNHGYWRASLHLRHAHKGRGDAYSGLTDHAQPPLAMLFVALLPALWYAPVRAVEIGVAVALVVLQIPMTARLLRRTGRFRYVWFAPLSLVRSFARGFGLVAGVLRLSRPGQR